MQYFSVEKKREKKLMGGLAGCRGGRGGLN